MDGSRYEAFLLHEQMSKEFARKGIDRICQIPQIRKTGDPEEESGCRVEIAEDEFSGGMRAVIPAKNVLIDESFAERMKHAGEICWI